MPEAPEERIIQTNSRIFQFGGPFRGVVHTEQYHENGNTIQIELETKRLPHT